MKKKRDILCIGFLIAALCPGTAGCGRGTNEDPDGSLVYLNYTTGVEEDGNYNSSLYGYNNNVFQGGDPDIIYVSEEEDPENGGYYYLYFGSTREAGSYREDHISFLTYLCYRSRNLFQWESCGALDGFILGVEEEDWCQMHTWAPSVIRNPIDGKYYLYFNGAIPADYGVAGFSSSGNDWDRMYLGVAVSDSPMGPFDVLYDTDPATGKRIPTINFQEGGSTRYPWSAIDACPFMDDDGTLYLYFNKHTDDHYSQMNGVFGMRMSTMTIPDYSTVTCLTQAGYATADCVPGNIEEISGGEPYYITDEGINEAPDMYKHNGKYYITYASRGYSDPGYSLHQAISDNPLGPFVKPDEEGGNPVLDGSKFGFVNGTASHDIIQIEDEPWIVYHRHGSVNGFDEGWERSISVDRVSLVENQAGETVLSANGPSKFLVWLPESISGYQNLAQKADIQISDGTGVQYLTDRVLPFYEVARDHQMHVDGDVTITMKWPEPVSISSVMVYNAREEDTAFSRIADIRFRLAGQPEWASRPYDYAVIEDLEFPERYWDPQTERYINCSPAVAEFGLLSVTELQIRIRKEDRLLEVNKLGEDNYALDLSEIIVLGKEESHE